MPGRPGPRTVLQAATTYTANSWTACSSTIKLDGNANTLLLYVASAVDSIGNVDFYVEHSADAGATYHLFCTGSDNPATWGPLAFSAAGQYKSIELAGLNLLAGETIKVYFRCSSAAAGATIAVTADPIFSVGSGSVSIGDIELELESITHAEDYAHASADVGVMPLAVRNDYNVQRAGTDGDYVPAAADDVGRTKVLTAVDPSQCSQIQAWQGTITSGGAAVTIDFNAQFGTNSRWAIIHCDGAGTLDVDFELESKVAGTHTGLANASVLTDSTANWRINSLVGRTITNVTDGSTGTITANTATTVTGPLTGGSENDWDVSDSYTISAAYVPTTPHVMRSGSWWLIDTYSIDTLRLDDNAADVSYRVVAGA